MALYINLLIETARSMDYIDATWRRLVRGLYGKRGIASIYVPLAQK